ncbi:MAG: hypothetical protein HY611_07140 [Elusimicrobia bacterium]|nr:hypothetical protein [Elusimicrobiota bacterium]
MKQTKKQIRFSIKRVLFGAAIGAGAAALAAGYAMERAFSPQYLKFLLIERLQAALQRSVSVEEVSVSLFRGLRIKNLRVNTRLLPGVPPNRKMLTAELLVARFQWLPLLSGKLALDRLELHAPQVTVYRLKDGQWSFMNIFSSGSPSSRGRSYGMFSGLNISNIRVYHGGVVAEDRMSDSRYSLSRVNLNLMNVRIDGPMTVPLSFDMDSRLRGKEFRGRVDLRAEVNLARLNWPEAAANIENFNIETEGVRLEASGIVKNFSSPAGRLTMTISPRGGLLSELAGFPQDAEIPPTQIETSFFLISKTNMRLPSFSLRNPEVRLRGYGDFHWGEDPKFKVELIHGSGDLKSCAKYIPRFGIYQLSGAAQASFVLTGSSGTLNLEQVRVQVDRGSAQFRGHRFQRVSLVSFLDGRDLHIQDLKGLWNATPWGLNGTLFRLPAPSHMIVHARTANLKVAELSAMIGSLTGDSRRREKKNITLKKILSYKFALPQRFPDISGDLTAGKVTHPSFTGGPLNFQWNLTGLEPGLEKLAGGIRYELKKGKVYKVPELIEKHMPVRLVFLPFMILDEINRKGSMGKWRLETFDYDSFRGDFKFQSGDWKVENCAIDAPLASMQATGSVNLVKEDLDLHVITTKKESRGMMSGPEIFSDEKGNLSVAFFLYGPILKPSWRLDWSKKR